jgi:S1-C subfamily serine protease
LIRAIPALGLVALIGAACGGSPIEEAESSLGRVTGTACLRPILATAVVVDDERMLTVAHAVAGADDDLHLVGLDGARYAVTVIGFDPDRDLALLDVAGLDAPSILMATAGEGDSGFITSISRDHEIKRIEYRVARVVTARSGDIYDEGEVLRKALDLEAVTEPGDSGAPLIDVSGMMVGMLFARSTDADGSWALHVDEIDAFLESVTGEEEVDRGRCR